MNPASHLPAHLRHTFWNLDQGFGARACELCVTGAARLDDALGGGLAQGALHELYAEASPDATTAAGFAIALAVRASKDRPVLWARQDYAGVETGGLYGPGLMDLGLDPGRLILVRARDALGVLRAGAEAARCPGLGAVVMEPWGETKALDLTASRRLALAADQSGVTVLMLRAAAVPQPSAAATRWSVRPRISRPLEADAPGHPAFSVTLLRHRAGLARQTFDVEWDRDRCAFADLTPLSGAVASPLAGGTLVEAEPSLRRTG